VFGVCKIGRKDLYLQNNYIVLAVLSELDITQCCSQLLCEMYGRQVTHLKREIKIISKTTVYHLRSCV